MYSDLDPLFLSQLRLAVMSWLVTAQEAEFNVLKEKTGATSGNLSVQIGKLQEAGYLTVEKTYRNNFPLTICRITPAGLEAFDSFFQNLESYLK